MSTTVPNHICSIVETNSGSNTYNDINCPATNPEILTGGAISASGISTTSLFVNGTQITGSSGGGSGVPKYTTAARDGLSPTQGDVIYNLTKDRIEWFDGIDWRTSTASGVIVTTTACGGVEVGGHCWYLSNQGESCNNACSGNGGYNEATRTYAGSDGTDVNCNSVLDALGAPDNAFTSTALGIAIGCFYTVSTGERYRDLTTTSEFQTSSNTRRACACND